jgi:hypothetical protein
MLTFATAMVSGQTWRYLAHRSRLIGPRVLVQAVIHAVEFVFLYNYIPHDLLFNILSIKLGLMAYSSFIWGALEKLRVTLREEADKKGPHAVLPMIAEALDYSAAYAGFFLVLTALYFLNRVVDNNGVANVADVVATILLARAAVETFVKTYHSSIFAIQRVFRPMEWILIRELIAFLIPLAFIKIIGPWALALGAFASFLASTISTIVFVRESFRNQRLQVSVLDRKLRLGWSHIDLSAGMSYLTSRIDSFLLLPLVYAYFKTGNSEGNQWVFFLHLCLPFFAANADWASLFYFDLSKMKDPVPANWRKHFEHQMVYGSIVLSVLAFVCSSVMIRFALGEVPIYEFLFLLPLFIFRSLYSISQMFLFVERPRYQKWFSLSFLLVGWAVATWFFSGSNFFPLIVGVIFGFSTMITMLERSFLGSQRSFSRIRSFNAWVREFHANTNEHFYIFKFAKKTPFAAIEPIALSLAQRFDESMVTYLWPTQIWFANYEKIPAEVLENVVVESGGFLESIIDGQDARKFVRKEIRIAPLPENYEINVRPGGGAADHLREELAAYGPQLWATLLEVSEFGFPKSKKKIPWSIKLSELRPGELFLVRKVPTVIREEP